MCLKKKFDQFLGRLKLKFFENFLIYMWETGLNYCRYHNIYSNISIRIINVNSVTINTMYDIVLNVSLQLIEILIEVNIFC